MFIDTHCHIDDQKLTDKDIIIKSLVRSNVTVAINMGCNVPSSINGKNLSERFEQIYFGAGFHPSDIDNFDDGCIETLIELSKHKKCVAIGEIGLDYHWDGFDKDRQINGFIKQLELAKTLKLPISVHCRDATEDMLKILKQNKNLLAHGGVMHCFSGSVETAKELLKLGFHISFAGTLTFKNAKSLIDVAKVVPLEYCLTETDSPYLAPHPYRGTLNEPKNVPFVTARLAEIKEKNIETVASQVMQNAKQLFTKL